MRQRGQRDLECELLTEEVARLVEEAGDGGRVGGIGRECEKRVPLVRRQRTQELELPGGRIEMEPIGQRRLELDAIGQRVEGGGDGRGPGEDPDRPLGRRATQDDGQLLGRQLPCRVGRDDVLGADLRETVAQLSQDDADAPIGCAGHRGPFAVEQDELEIGDREPARPDPCELLDEKDRVLRVRRIERIDARQRGQAEQVADRKLDRPSQGCRPVQGREGGEVERQAGHGGRRIAGQRGRDQIQ